MARELERGEEHFLEVWVALQRAGAEKELARGALETVLLRARAEKKFSRAREMFFTREGLEQASAEPLSRHRAARFRGLERIADLGCGIGGDTLALAERAPVWAVDRDELRLRMAQENLRAYAPIRPVRFLLADLLRPALSTAARKGMAFFCDPSRRKDSRRVFSVRRYGPPLAEIVRLYGEGDAALCVKISPGVRWEEIEEEPCEVEFVSFEGELREAVLWYGPLRTAIRRATILPADATMTETEPSSDAISPPRAVLYEPDPSLLRAGLVRQLAARLGAARIDPEIAYLTADEFHPTPWARAYRIEEAMPFGLKRLRQWLRARGVGRVTVKKRGSPLEPDDLERQLKLRGGKSRILFLTKVGGKPHVLIAENIEDRVGLPLE
ncbi:MAG: class I SAM-dependent methyltransferase [Anaerolineales bacterium]